jgi:sulfite exporter TauE/SafE
MSTPFLMPDWLPLAGAVLSASLLGSLHCVGMCGPLLALAGGPRGQGGRAGLLTAYHLGRLSAYAALGALAGALGAALDLSGQAFGLQRLALGLTGALMLLFGAVQLASAFGLLAGPAGLPGGLLPAGLRERARGSFARLAPRLGRWPRALRPLGLGLLSAFLPCGWLYAFVALAAGQGGPLPGALVMAAFWLGGLPALSVFSLLVGRLLASRRRLVPLVSAAALMMVGALALVGRGQLGPLALTGDALEPAAALEALEATPECCRHGAAGG